MNNLIKTIILVFILIIQNVNSINNNDNQNQYFNNNNELKKCLNKLYFQSFSKCIKINNNGYNNFENYNNNLFNNILNNFFINNNNNNNNNDNDYCNIFKSAKIIFKNSLDGKEINENQVNYEYDQILSLYNNDQCIEKQEENNEIIKLDIKVNCFYTGDDPTHIFCGPDNQSSMYSSSNSLSIKSTNILNFIIKFLFSLLSIILFIFSF